MEPWVWAVLLLMLGIGLAVMEVFFTSAGILAVLSAMSLLAALLQRLLGPSGAQAMVALGGLIDTHAATASAVSSLDSKTGDLAGVVRDVLAARAERDGNIGTGTLRHLPWSHHVSDCRLKWTSCRFLRSHFGQRRQSAKIFKLSGNRTFQQIGNFVWARPC